MSGKSWQSVCYPVNRCYQKFDDGMRHFGTEQQEALMWRFEYTRKDQLERKAFLKLILEELTAVEQKTVIRVLVDKTQYLFKWLTINICFI